MPANALYDITAQRLRDYGLFSEETIARVASTAQFQASFDTYQSFFDAVGLKQPELYQYRKGSGVPVVDIAAVSRKEKGTLAIHLPMANPLDPNQLFQIATIAATNPDYRIVGFGNPSSKPYFFKEQNLKVWQRFAIANTKYKKALIGGELHYLKAHHTSKVTHVGYSYGAHKALIAALNADKDSISGVITVDPVAHPRGLKQLLGDFMATFGPLGKYVNRTELDIYFQARKASSLVGWKYRRYVRPINIAIGFLLARVDFMQLLKKDMALHESGRFAVAWGTKSELGNDAHMFTSLNKLAEPNPRRLKRFQLKDDAHALANDIHLHAAIIHEALRG